MAWLDTNPPARPQFRRPRRDDPSGVIVLHTAENTPDTVATDGGAEAVARFIQRRGDPGSYHELVDADSAIQLVAYDCEAFHDATGTNRHSLSVSVATRADFWPLAPPAWRDGAVAQAAAAAARQATWLQGRYGIEVPARRITADEARARVPGFTTHAELDPGRRSDPGPGFPWPRFLNLYRIARQTPLHVAHQEDDPVTLITTPDHRVVLLHAGRLVHISTPSSLDPEMNAWDLSRDTTTWDRLLRAYGPVVV